MAGLDFLRHLLVCTWNPSFGWICWRTIADLLFGGLNMATEQTWSGCHSSRSSPFSQAEPYAPTIFTFGYWLINTLPSMRPFIVPKAAECFRGEDCNWLQDILNATFWVSCNPYYCGCQVDCDRSTAFFRFRFLLASRACSFLFKSITTLYNQGRIVSALWGFSWGTHGFQNPSAFQVVVQLLKDDV